MFKGESIMYYDIYYILLMLPAVIIATWAQIKVNSTFKKYERIPTMQGLTGAQAARNILDANGLYDVQIEHIAGSLTDHFDPRSNVVRLSDSVYTATNVAAVGVAAHETGHAVQYAEGYAPIKIRNAILPVTQIGSYASWPLLLLGIIFSNQCLAWAGVALFSAVVLFQLITLPVEFNASKRAITVLENGMLTTEETAGARKVLNAAAFTYVAALFTAIVNLLRLVMIAFNSRSKN